MNLGACQEGVGSSGYVQKEKGIVDIGYLQEVRYRGQGTRVYGGEEKYKEGQIGVRIMVKEGLVEEVIEIKRLDDRMMKMAMVCGRKSLHISSVFDPQHGVGLKRKRGTFVTNYQIIYIMSDDMNCLTGSPLDSFEDVVGCFRTFWSEKPRRGRHFGIVSVA
mgnify:CR=1 FL=1